MSSQEKHKDTWRDACKSGDVKRVVFGSQLAYEYTKVMCPDLHYDDDDDLDAVKLALNELIDHKSITSLGYVQMLRDSGAKLTEKQAAEIAQSIDSIERMRTAVSDATYARVISSSEQFNKGKP